MPKIQPFQDSPRTIKGYGWKPSLPHLNDDRRAYSLIAPEITLPPVIDLRPLDVPIYDQGELGSCTGNGIGACWQFSLKKQGKPAPMPSRLFIYYFERVIEKTVNEDAGAQIYDGLAVLQNQGCCDEALHPYVISKFTQKPSAAAVAAAAKHEATQAYAVKQNLKEIKTCLASGFPIVMGFTVYESFETQKVSKTGIVPMPKRSEQVMGGHCVCIVGYSDATNVFFCRNSWGKDWGKNGYFQIPYDYFLNPNLASDFWTVRLVA